MTLELRVLSGARAGATERFDTPLVSVGRHPESGFRFDPQDDLDVSTRHAELRRVDGVWRVHDLGSTNGTFVNGERVEGARVLAEGDTIAFGTSGPRVAVRFTRGGNTDVRIAAAVRAQTAWLRRGLLASAGLLVATGVGGMMWWRRQGPAAPFGAPLAHDTAQQAPSTRADFTQVRDRNDPAVALIASDLDGKFVAGTAFGVDPRGLLVTNRHLMQTPSGAPPRRIRVLYANTRDWLPAHLVRVSATDDLALIQLDDAGTYPVVAGVSRTGERARPGAPIAAIGFPYAVETPMEGTGVRVTARTTTTAGTVSKRLDDLLQIDAYAGKGSSGSPVFDARGEVVGVVYGGAPGSGGRIVFSVPAERLVAFLR